ncbi:MAG TPA: patatin-like phospholipase family protein, partial [Acidimicrobiales bacterium]|nr:patatin-like phospholipase family protein [Acidimicrobiales bacterium]
VLGGGGVLGSAEVGMLKALLARGILPDLVVGSSVGALNGAFLAGAPEWATVTRMAEVWTTLSDRGVFGGSVVGQLRTLARHGTHLHDNTRLRRLIDEQLPAARIEDLPVRFECVAASIEKAAAHYFSSGPLADAVLASCAVPGLLPPVCIDGEHFLDGGLVRSVPVGRAVELGAARVFVLHVGRLEQRLVAPRRPWEVAQVAFEISRRHSFEEEMARLPTGVDVHVLPTGSPPPGIGVRYRSTAQVAARIQAAQEATATYLDRLAPRAGDATGSEHGGRVSDAGPFPPQG